MFMKIEPFWSWHTPTAWTGYILFVDGIVWKKRADSWLTRSRVEFVFLAIVSIPLWLIFEFYNLYIRNWHYINLHESAFWRNFGYAWAFATIWPAIFETGELVAVLRGQPPHATESTRAQHRVGRDTLLIAIGAAMLIWPLVFPSQYLAAPVWLGFILLLDPINARLGGESLLGDLSRNSTDRLINLCAAGFICGLVWEFWNFWARTKWIYTVPILPELKIFEMPVLGYFGFPAFALECFTMYVTVRLALWRGRTRRISL
jgi:hypothetical protein